MWVALIVAAQTAVLAAYAASADARSSQGCIDVLTCCVRRFGLIGVAGVSGAFGPAWLASASGICPLTRQWAGSSVRRP